MSKLLSDVAIAQDRARSCRVLVTMCLGVFIAQLDTSLVNLAIKPIGADLAADVSRLQWVVDAYNLAYASFLLTGGALGDLHGRRRVFALGVATFTIGSVVCGFAPNGTILIAGRAVTGLGAALMLPTSLAILAATYPDPKERVRAIGIWASCNGVALAIGPTAGGLLVDSAGWRSIFLLIVPVGIWAFAMALKAVPESAQPEGRRLDLPGQALAILALGGLAFAVIEGAHRGWNAVPTMVSIGICVVSAVLFVRIESRTEGALVPLELFRRPAFSAAMVVAALMTFGMYAMLFLVPLYLQAVRGATAFVAGLELLPLSLTFVLVSSHSGGLVARFGPRAVMTAGMALMGAGLLILAGLSGDTSLLTVEAALLVIGGGLGLNAGPVMAVAVASVPPARSGTASGLGNTARMIGATLGVAVLGAVFAVHAGQDMGAADRIVEGLRAAFLVGSAGELTGALVALAFIRRSALRTEPA